MRKAVYSIVCALALVSCAALRPTAKPTLSDDDEGDTLLYSPRVALEYNFLEGVKRLSLADTVAARRAFDKALAIDSLYAPANYWMANTLFDDPVKGLEYSQRANRLDTTVIWYQIQLAQFYLYNDRIDDAIEVNKLIISRNPGFEYSYNLLSMLYSFEQRYAESLAVLDEAIEKFGPVEEFLDHKRSIYLRTNNPAKAIEVNEELVENYPDDPLYFASLAELYAYKGVDSLAADNYKKALALDPSDPDILLSYAEYNRDRGNFLDFFSTVKSVFALEEVPLEAKIAYFGENLREPLFYQQYLPFLDGIVAEVAAQYPSDPQALRFEARHYLASGKYDKALELYAGQVDAGSADGVVYKDMMALQSYLGLKDEVMGTLDRAIEKFGPNSDFMLIKASFLLENKQYEEAANYTERVIGAQVSDSVRSNAYGMLGNVYHEQGEDKKAYKAYDKSLKFNSRNILVLNNYAYYLSETGKDLDKALKMIRVVMESEPSNPTYIDTYGWILYKMGRLTEAKEALNTAVSLDTGNSPVLLLHYGDVLYALKDDFMARHYWETALTYGADPDEVARRIKMLKNK